MIIPRIPYRQPNAILRLLRWLFSLLKRERAQQKRRPY